MTEQDREEFIAVLGTVAEAYSKELSDGLVRVYFQQLSKFGIEEIARAGSILMTRSRFWPTIADFHEAIQGSQEDQGALAWNLLVDTLRDVSAWTSLEVRDDPAFVHALEQVFGSWIHCGDTLPDGSDPMFASLRKQFMTSYRTYEQSGRRITLPKRLPGRHEVQNAESRSTWRPGTELVGQSVYVLTRADQDRKLLQEVQGQIGQGEQV